MTSTDSEERAPLIHVGECVEWLETLREASADHAIFDPPYSEHVHAKSMRGGSKTLPNARGKKRRSPIGRDLGFAALTPALQLDVACEAARVVRRWVITFCNVELVSSWKFAMQGAGLDYVRTCCWVKPNGSPQFTGDRPGSGWECFVVGHRPGVKRWNYGGHRGVFVHNVDGGMAASSRTNKTQKPISLMLEIVDAFTDVGDLVIDPFSGSGTTGAACIRLGRRFAGAELDPAQAALANERLDAESVLSTVAAQRAKQAPLFPSVSS